MAGRGGRMVHPQVVGPRGPSVPLPAQGGLLRGPPAPPWNGQPVPPVQMMQPPPQVIGGAGAVEHKLQTQHAEIQRIMTDNQRFAATHVALRQELAAAQAEGQRLQQALSVMQSEKDAQMRGLMEKAAKMEADLRAVEPLKAELQALRGELQNVHARRQEFEQAANQQIQQLTQEGQKMRQDLQQLPALRQECEGLRQELQRARGAVEFEKKSNMEHQEQRQAMEKNLVTMARDVEKLRAELTVAKNSRTNGTGQFGGAIPAQETGYANPGLQRPGYGEGYGSTQAGGMPASGADGGGQYGHSQAPAWGQQQGYGQDAAKTDPYSGGAGYGAADAAPAYGAHQDATTFSRPGDGAYPGANADAADAKAADGWTEHQAADGKIFYFNSQTGDSQWEKPQAMLDREAQAAAASSAIPIPIPTQMAPGQGQQDHGVPQGSQYIPPPGFTGAPQGWMNQAQAQGPGAQQPYGQPPFMAGHYGQPEGVPPQQGMSHPYGQSQTSGQRGPGQQVPGVPPQQGQIHSPARAQPSPQPASQGQGHRQPMPQPNQSQGGGRPGQQQQQMNQAHVSARPILNPKPEPVKSPQANPQRDNLELPPHGPNGANLFVFGFPDDFNDQKLAALFAPYGKPINAKVGMDQATGRSKGYGFVSMESVKAADAAIQGVNGQVLAGRRVKVERKRGDHDQIQQQQQQHVPPGGGPGPNRFRHEQHVGYRPY